MRPSPRVLLVLPAFLVLAGGAARGDDRLDEVVVTAPPADDAATAEAPTTFASVIDATAAPAEMETLADALSSTVGVHVRRFGGLGDFSTVSIRGFAPAQVQVYLDGVPLSRARNEVVSLGDLPLDAVERVEVYRGGTPLRFAQAGPGGVVNVVTRRPGDAPLSAASASVGSFTTRKLDAARSVRGEAWDGLVFAHYLGSAGDFRFTNDNGTPENAGDDRTERRRNNAFDLGNLTARARWRPAGPFELALTSDSFVRHEELPGADVLQARETSLRTIRQLGNLALAVAGPGGLPLEGEASGWAVYEDRTFDDPAGEITQAPTETRTRSLAAGGQVHGRMAVGRHHVPGLLLAMSHERFAERDRRRSGPAPADRTRLRATISAEDELLLLGERVSIVPGGRWEVFRDRFAGTLTRDFLSPRLGVRVEAWPGVTLLGNVGRAARVPNLDELFGTAGVIVGNPELEPETAFTRDAGVRWRPRRLSAVLSDVAFEYAWFESEVEDLIALVQIAPSVARPENVTRARLRGHEVAARGRVARRIALAVNYTYQDARDTGDVTFLRGRRLPGRPEHEAYGEVALGWSPTRPLPLGGWARRLWPGHVAWNVNLIAETFLDRANVRRVGSRALHGVGAGLALPLLDLHLGVEVRNVGDSRTRDVLNFPLPGRAVFVTLSRGFRRSP